MEGDLKSLRIDRGRKQSTEPSSWAKWWIIAGVSLFLLAGLGNFLYSKWNAAVPVDLYRVELPQAGAASVAGTQNVILNACFNPPCGIGGKAKTSFWLKLFHRLHQSNISL